jgi:hypothetical protein
MNTKVNRELYCHYKIPVQVLDCISDPHLLAFGTGGAFDRRHLLIDVV